MSSATPTPPDPPPGSQTSSLAERLQDVTEALAAARSEEAVVRVVMEPAVQALGALASSVLLSADRGSQLVLSAVSGAASGGGGQTVWQDGALDDQTPAGTALLHRQPLYFEHAGALTSEFPLLEARTGAIAAVATAVLPMLLDGAGLGVLVLDFREPHTFSAEERRFLQTLAGQCAVALGRVQVLSQMGRLVQARTAELEAVLDCLSDAVFVGDMSGITRVNRAGLRMLGYSSAGELQRRLPELSEQLCQRDPLTRARLDPADEPFAHALRGENATREVLIRRQDTGEDRLIRVAASPMLRGGERVGAVAVSSDLTESRHALEVEREALNAFVAFTEDAGRLQDQGALAASAFLALGRLFPGSAAALYDWQDECWVLDGGSSPAGSGGGASPTLAEPPMGRHLPPDMSLLAQMVWTRAATFRDAGSDDESLDGLPPGLRVCAYPIVREGMIVTALLVWGGAEPLWSARDRAIVNSVGRSFSLLYDRIAVTAALRARQHEAEARAREAESEREALDVFVAFSESVSHITDQEELTRAAFGVLGRLLPQHTATLYGWNGRLWHGQWTTRPGAESGSLPPTAPLMRELLARRAPVFRDADEGPGAHPHSVPVAAYPIEQGGSVVAAVVLELEEARSGWLPRERAVVNSVGRSFSLLFERVGTGAALLAQKREAETRTQALEAFAELTRHLDVPGGRLALVRKAQEVVLGVLPSGMAVYYEPQDGRWRVRSQVGAAPTSGLQTLLDAGLDRAQFRTVSVPWERGEPTYQDSYDPRADQLGTDAPAIGAVAALPLMRAGQPVGVFTVALLRDHRWSRADRALLDGVLHALPLALEQMDGVAQLAARSGELELSNAALSSANDELEAFAYSASHDLRTPVRHVLGFADLAEQALTAGATDKTVRYLGVVREAATRMNTLIDAMLLLSRAGRRVYRTEAVPLGSLVEQAREDVAAEFPGREVEWRVSPLPSVQGDRDTLQQVMTNLLSNAVKYSGREKTSVVEVWAERGPQEVRVSVRDNGVGFDPRYQAKLFGVFQRLHSQDDFQGTGVGLATVKRIVSRYGGQVFAHGVPGQGATFGFTLPELGRARGLTPPAVPLSDQRESAPGN